MMQYELHINPVTYHQITAEGEKKNLQFVRCLQNSCTPSQQRGKALCLFLEDLHRNGVRTNLSGSVPHLQLATPRLKGSFDPLYPCNILPSELAHKDAGSRLVISLALLVPTRRKATASPQHSDKSFDCWRRLQCPLQKHCASISNSASSATHLCDAQPRNRARRYQLLMWYYHIIKPTRRRQCCEERPVAVGVLQRWQRCESKRENCKGTGVPKKHSDMIVF